MMVESASGAISMTKVSPATEIWTTSTDVDFDIEVTTDASSAYAIIDLDSSLVGWYRGEDNAEDSSSQENDATGFTGSYVAGKFGKAFTGDNFNIPGERGGPINFGIDDSFTWSVWVNKDADDGEEGIIGFDDYYRLMWHGSNDWMYRFGVDDSNFVQKSTAATDPVGNWRHLAITHNAVTNQFTLHLNGVKKATGSDPSVDFWDPGDMHVWATAQDIDELLIFNRALTDEEILGLYNASASDLETTFTGVLELDEHAYTIHAVDEDDNTESITSTVTVDTADSVPYVTLASPLSPISSTSGSQTFTVSAKATNAGVDLDSATFWLGPVDNKVQIETKDFESPTSGYNQLEFTQTGLSGDYEWNMWVVDDDGNGAWADANSLITIGDNNYYVATDGSDSDPGSIDEPFLTIQKFADIAIAGDTCFIREGTYRETITPANSGNAESEITYKSYPGETAVVSGADVLSGEWSVHSGSIYKRESTTDLGLGFNQVFVDGNAMIWARYPNTENYSGKVDDYSQHLAETFEVTSGSSETTSTSATVGCVELTEPNAYWDGALIHVIYSPRYHSVTGTVDSYTVGILNVTLDLKALGGDISDDGAFYLANKLEALDVTSEWFLNTGTNTMYLWTPDSTDPGDSVVEVKARQVAFDLDGISYTAIEDISVFAANITTDEYSSYNTLTGLGVKYVSHYTVIDTGLVTTGSRGIRDTGIILDGDYNTLERSTINYSAGNGVASIGDNCNVLSSNIYNTNYNVTGTAGVTMGEGGGFPAGQNNTVSYCTIADTGRDAMSISGASNTTITHNDISGTRSIGWTSDLGAIYAIATDGGKTTIAYNRIHDCRSYGIYLDNGSSYYDIYYNVVTDLTWTSGVEHSIQLNQPNRYCNIHNNTLYNGHIRTNRIGSSDLSLEGTTISNNILRAFSKIGSAKFTGYADPNDDATLTTNITTDTDEPWSKDGILLYNSYSSRDFRLRADSLAVGTGTDEGYLTDIAGNSVSLPQDIGAYEFMHGGIRGRYINGYRANYRSRYKF